MLTRKQVEKLVKAWAKFPDKNNASFSNAIYKEMLDMIIALYDALGKFADYDEMGRKKDCDFHLRHDEHGWAKAFFDALPPSDSEEKIQ